jgi:hypothetical protein
VRQQLFTGSSDANHSQVRKGFEKSLQAARDDTVIVY